MVRSRERSAFGFLAQLGLKTVNVIGDGNCMFSALSDQVFGTQAKAKELRSAVIDHMRKHSELYIDFVIVDDTRRNPKRKNTKAATCFSFVEATLDERQNAFEAHLQNMAKGGTWGSNIELQAFANAFNCKVHIYHESAPTLVVQPQADNESTDRMSAYIAYHEWQHYSSVRNMNGPFTGLPCVQPRDVSQADQAKAQDSRKGVIVKTWMVKSVMTSLPHLMDQALVIRVLEKNRGSVDAAINEFLELDGRSSSASSPGSTSIERESESDSEDEDPIRGPNMRQNRRIKEAKEAAKRLANLETAKLASNQAIKSTSIDLPADFTAAIKPSYASVLATSLDTTFNSVTSKLPPTSTLPPPTTLPKLSVDPKTKFSMSPSGPTPVSRDSPPTNYIDTLFI